MLELVQNVGQIIPIDNESWKISGSNIENWNAGTDIWEAKIHWKNMNWLEEKEKTKKSRMYDIFKNQRNDFSDLLR